MNSRPRSEPPVTHPSSKILRKLRDSGPTYLGSLAVEVGMSLSQAESLVASLVESGSIRKASDELKEMRHALGQDKDGKNV